ncbi:MAG: hypothetical protein JNK72_06655 [Myxococcales bacterium]|nr:hypothetical protein [Myxococcales bacterium]
MNRGYREAVSVDHWRRRFQTALTQRFGLRLHMAAVVLAVLAVGVLTGRVLRGLVDSMATRYALSVMVGYAAFFAVVHAWGRYVVRSLAEVAPHTVAPGESAALVAQMGQPTGGLPDAGHAALMTEAIDLGSAPSRRHRWVDPGISAGPGSDASAAADAGGSTSGWSLDADGEGLAAVVIVALVSLVVLVLFGAAIWCVYEAPVILGEVVFELVLASALARAARTVDGRGWSRALWKATWKPALALVAVVVLLGAVTQRVCPGVTTLHDAVTRCVLHAEAP